MEILKRLVLCLLLFATILASSTRNCLCGVTDDEISKSKIETRIMGGETAERGQFPWQVALVYRESFFCGGTIINNLYIMTAGHCFKGKHYDRVKYNTTILISRYHLSLAGANPNNRWSQEIILHPSYNANVIYDLALVKLNKPLEEYNNKIMPICLPTNNIKTYEGVTAVVSGWGSEKIVMEHVPYLRSAKVTVSKNVECLERSRRYKFPFQAKLQMCQLFTVNGTCKGDSGGPLAYKESSNQFVQIGITSASAGNVCVNGSEILFTRVSEFVPWIKEHTKDATYCKRSELSPSEFRSKDNLVMPPNNVNEKLSTTTDFIVNLPNIEKMNENLPTRSVTSRDNLSTPNKNVIVLFILFILMEILIAQNIEI